MSMEKECNVKHTEYSDSFYGEYEPFLHNAGAFIIQKIEELLIKKQVQNIHKPIEHYKMRVKSEESMKEKLARKELPITVSAALQQIHDAVGVRIVCPFVDDVYEVVKMLKEQPEISIINEKDYIRVPKENGYRSYHLIIKVSATHLDKQKDIFMEIQLRTIAMDCWASLEHQLKYKHNIKHQELLVKELKRCADEMASTDLNLQTIRDLIEDSN